MRNTMCYKMHQFLCDKNDIQGSYKQNNNKWQQVSIYIKCQFIKYLSNFHQSVHFSISNSLSQSILKMLSKIKTNFAIYRMVVGMWPFYLVKFDRNAPRSHSLYLTFDKLWLDDWSIAKVTDWCKYDSLLSF